VTGRHFDVVIIGARCAGAALATCLARAGAHVLMVDHSPMPSDQVLSTHNVHPPGMDILDDIGVADGSGSANTRGLKFSADGNRMYLINRDPPVLQIFDTSPNEGGLARNQLVGATDICREGSMLDVMDSGDGDRAYLSCFSDGTIYVVDPRGLSQVEDIIQTGRGPYAVTGVPARKKLFVSNYLEDTVAVIDTTPGATTMNRVVLRIGVTKPPDADTFQQ